MVECIYIYIIIIHACSMILVVYNINLSSIIYRYSTHYHRNSILLYNIMYETLATDRCMLNWLSHGHSGSIYDVIKHTLKLETQSFMSYYPHVRVLTTNTYSTYIVICNSAIFRHPYY